MNKFGLLVFIILAGCAKTETIRTSNNTMLIQTSAAPTCGVQGAMKVAEKMAAIETIRAGYDRYIIMDGDAQNNVTSYQAPGSYHHTGNAYAYGNYAHYSGTTSYQPGPIVYNGSNDASFHIKMLKKGQKGYSNAISAKDVLGSDWQVLVNEGVSTCS